MTIREFEIVGLLAAVATFWSQITSLLAWPLSLVIAHVECDTDAGRVVLSYLRAHAKYSPVGETYYRADWVHVRPLGRVYPVFAENLVYGTSLFWLRHVPIRYRWQGASESVGSALKFAYLRGTLNWEALIAKAAVWSDARRQSHGNYRHVILYHGAQDQQTPSGDDLLCASEGVSLLNQSLGLRMLTWAPGDIGYGKPIDLTTMSLRSETQELVRDVDHFLASREWYEERGIPWRRGWLLHGKPGTGKTSLVRGLAVEHDLPVHTFDLGALDNGTFTEAWGKLAGDAPCIALIEDVDSVYCGREHVTEGVGPTFDCLLQAIGGISTCDGVLLFVTTNNPQAIDDALMRGGRLDKSVEFHALDRAGRTKMALRILGTEAAAANVEADKELQELSPADYQERLCRIAIKTRFPSE